VTTPATLAGEWQDIETAPKDGRFRLYGLTVNSSRIGEFFEAHYLALTEDGELVHPSGDLFDDWHYNDFEVWADIPQPPNGSGE
jgi:hypothetical protein